MGAAEHGHVGVLVRHLAQLQHHAVEARQHNLVTASADLQRMAGVVDVFAGAGKVHEFRRLEKLGAGIESALDPVFHRLHVVVGGLFNLLDCLGVRFGEVGNQAVQIAARAF
ncbi:hypothetical protein D3C72_2235310 [compost metagenome]